MNYIFSISQAMLDRAAKPNHYSQPIILSAVRDLLLLAESQFVNQAMVKTSSASQENEPYHIDMLIDSLKDTNRDIQDVLKSIEYLQQNIGQSMPIPSEQQQEIAQKTAYRLAQLRDEAVVIKDYELASELEFLFQEIGLLG